MSHQTGIKASEDLKRRFAAAKDGSVRLLKVVIRDEKLEFAHSEPPRGTWEQDYDRCVEPCIEEKQACYVLFRFDTKSSLGYEWLFISFSSDHAQVRDKMLYSATKATLKQEFGGGQIKDELFGTVPDDVNLSGYHKHLEAKHAPAPLTLAEEELEMIKKNEIQTAGVDAKHKIVQAGIAFPFEEEVFQALQELQRGAINYVQMKIDLQKEEIHLATQGDITASQLSSQIPTQNGSYHFFRYDHSHEGDYLRSIVFVYSMPASKCPIKERMLYSSCKGPVLDVVEQQLHIQVERRVETDDPSEVTEQFLYDEVHPKKDIVTQKFSRPKGPANRGPKRMTRVKQDHSNNV